MKTAIYIEDGLCSYTFFEEEGINDTYLTALLEEAELAVNGSESTEPTGG